MSSLSQLNSINEIANLAGIFNWQMDNARYVNPDNSTVSFQVLGVTGTGLDQYAQGLISTFNLANNVTNNALNDALGLSHNDPNTGLFNTTLSTLGIDEDIKRKVGINEVPFANYTQLTDQGIGGQKIVFNVIFAGTMYMTAFLNFMICLFSNKISGLGTLYHPLYGKIDNVIPIKIGNKYSFDKRNCIMLEVYFHTSDISHLNPLAITSSLTSEINKWYVGTQTALFAIQNITSSITSLQQNISAGFQ